jgi:hypothetical protein
VLRRDDMIWVHDYHLIPGAFSAPDGLHQPTTAISPIWADCGGEIKARVIIWGRKPVTLPKR